MPAFREGEVKMHELKLDEASLDALPEVIAFVDSHLEEAGWPLKSQMQIDVAIEELYVNIVHYAYVPETGPALIRMEFEDESTVRFTLIDEGIPFDPTKQQDPDTSLPAAQREIGGLGIYMVKKSMDGMSYRRENGNNVLTVWKKR